MTRYCTQCDADVMPIKTDGSAFKCPKHGWIGTVPGRPTRSATLTPDEMQRRIDALRMAFQFDTYR